MLFVEPSKELGFSVATAHPTLRERRWALAAVGMIFIALAAVAPFADIQLWRLDSFIPSVQVVISITSMITAALLFGQFSTMRVRALLVLAGGYLFVALIVVSHIVVFPGAFGPTGLLGAGAQSAAWLYIFWHFGFPGAVIGYVFLKDSKDSVQYSTSSAIFWTVMIVIGLVCLLTWIATAKHHLLPALFADTTSFGQLATYATGIDLVLSAFALVLLWKRGRSVLDIWLSVTNCAFIAELTINTVMISGRFTLGWYSGRAFAILVATIVMILMLAQTFAFNARLMGMTIMLKRERDNKLASLDAVVASIEHEVRQPLAAIAFHGATAQLYLDRTPPNVGEARRILGAMVDSSMRATEIFQSIRALFSNFEPEKQLVDVNQLAAEALDLLHGELDVYGIETNIQQTPQLPLIMAHKGQLREVLINLIQNACDAMKTVSGRRRSLQITTNCQGDNAIVVSVEDTGIGISPEKMKSIFEPFFSTKTKGMGLGLAICKMILEQHGGKLSAASDMYVGARFEITLPTKIAEPSVPGTVTEQSPQRE
jgi:signal transduction histidine kinase